MKKAFMLFLLVLFISASTCLSAGEARLLRQPHISNNKIVFIYAGNVFTVPVTGGVATKLTSFEGFEVFPKFSPDGNWIAFSGEYNGSRNIFVIPSNGGKPKQVTHYPDVGVMPPRGGWDQLPYDWTPDGKKIFVRMNRSAHGERIGKYFLVDPFNESIEEELQIPEGGPATLSPDGKKIAYSIKSREFRTWKRYKAGFAQDVFIYHLETDKVEKITEYAGTDNFPMWIGEKIYFNSDRSDVSSDDPRTLNLYSYDLNTKEIKKITNFTEYDVMRPSRGGDYIVFENGGFIFTHNTNSGETKKVKIIINDDLPLTRIQYKDASKNIESYYVSPTGKRALFGARGDIFTVPAEHGDIVNITNTPKEREILVDWSPDGKYISYISDASGDYELYIKEYNNTDEPIQLTEETGSWIEGYAWSYDSKKILVDDKKNRLRFVDIESKAVTEITQSKYSRINGYVWSPDNKWVVYTTDEENGLTSLFIYSLDTEKKFKLTKNPSDNYNPAFSKDGKYISFVSRRDFNFGDRNFEAKLYIAPLNNKIESPFAYRNDDEKVEEDKKENDKSDQLIVKVELDKFDDRVVAYPVPNGWYSSLTPFEDGLLYRRNGTLYKFDLKSRKEEKVMSNVRGYILSADGKKLMYSDGTNYGITALTADIKSGSGKLDLSKMKLSIDPQTEWKQIYTDGWRIMRDWFYDPGMHGVDWQAMHDKYLPLVEHVGNRTDLDYIFGELIGELNAGHCYVNSGDAVQIERVPTGLLGCQYKADGEYYKISKIYNGENWNPELRSPLTETGVNVSEGDYLIAIDGVEVNTNSNPYKFLENKIDVEVTLLINNKPSKSGARSVKVKPIESEIALRHYEWVQYNTKLVDKLSNGKIGYIYVPNTGFPGFREFYKGWLSQNHKEGLIIDDRYNGGGSFPNPMINDLAHPTLQYWDMRNLEMSKTPSITHEGPKAMLINGRSSSGGDAFPDYFRTMKLGPLIGQTTWGGLIGYSGSPRFVDGGGFAIPQFGYVNLDGEWDVEYYGVKPDIEVFDDPGLIQAGRDPSIEKAVEYILEELKKNPPKKIKKPQGPKRN